MKRPLITEAPLQWLEAVVTETEEDADEKELAITINSVDDGKDYEFSYVLGDVRAELKRRTAS
jgi:hypothetical protein